MSDVYFFDTDCLSSFLMNDYESILTSLYSGNIYLTSHVYQEACKKEKNKEKIIQLEEDGHIKKISIMYGTKEHKEFVKLTDTLKINIGLVVVKQVQLPCVKLEAEY